MRYWIWKITGIWIYPWDGNGWSGHGRGFWFRLFPRYTVNLSNDGLSTTERRFLLKVYKPKSTRVYLF